MGKWFSKRQITVRTGLNQRHVRTLIDARVLIVLPESTPRRPKISVESFMSLQEGEHYVVCLECGAWAGQITSKHLKSCSGMGLDTYLEIHPNSPCMSDIVKSNKKKSKEEKGHQARKMREHYQSPEGNLTRRKVSEASKRLHANGYRERAAQHLRRMGQDPKMREFRSTLMKKRWESEGLRKTVEQWHQDNRKESLELAANARSHITTHFSSIHRLLKERLEHSQIHTVTEHRVGYFSLDEADPILKVAIEVDGCYWHGCEECGFDGHPDTIRTDQRKDTFLRREGWEVIRIPGHAIRSDLDRCIEIIQSVMEERDVS